MSKKNDRLSVFLSLVLRHKPEVIGLALDSQGYLKLDDLVRGINKSGREVTLETILEIVNSDSKKRYSLSEDNSKIRASQGHSIPVDLSLANGIPTGQLFHGTAERFKESIESNGLIKSSREYVHLSQDIATAISVGSRRGKPVVFLVDHKQMLEDGHELWVSENNVWLSENIPPKYLSLFEVK